MCANKLFAHYIIHALIQMLEYMVMALAHHIDGQYQPKFNQKSTRSKIGSTLILSYSLKFYTRPTNFKLWILSLFQLLFDKDEK